MCYETDFIHCKLKNFYAFLFALVLVPICWLRTFKYLSFVSLIGNVSIIIALAVIFYYADQEIKYHPENHEDGLILFRASRLPLFFGVVVFNFEGNAILINIHHSMKQPERFNAIFT